jgi:polyketide cyclase/dehydrase/lipid transport protein
MTVHIEQCVDIAADVSKVWAEIDDVQSHGEWMRDAIEITPVSDQHEGVGAEFTCLTKIGPFRERDLLRVTEWEPGAVMGIEHLGVVKGWGRLTLVAQPSGTRFCWTEQLQFPWWMGGAVGERAAKPVLGRVWRGNLERLRARVEAKS